MSENRPTPPGDEPPQPAQEAETNEPVEHQNNGAAAGEPAAADSQPGDDLTEQLQQIEQQLHEANQRALRSQAELENFRKRVRREMEDERRYAALPVIRDLLQVVDNLQRAIAAAEQHENSGLLQGVKMVAQHFGSVLEQHHCKEIAAAGQPFDPHLHEAIGQQPSDEYPPGTVTQVARAGYQLHDRVVRPSQVFVSTAPAQNQPQGK